MIVTRTFGSAALQTMKWVSDVDGFLVGVRSQQSGACYYVVTKLSGWNTGLQVTSAVSSGGTVGADENFFYALGGGSAGTAENLRIPVSVGEPIFICFSAAGWLTLYLDPNVT